jgi:hypothetical protein
MLFGPAMLSTGMKGFRPDAIIMDAPRSYHLPKFIIFLGVEGLLIATAVLAYSELFPTTQVSHTMVVCAPWWHSGAIYNAIKRSGLLIFAFGTGCSNHRACRAFALLPADGGANVPEALRVDGCSRLDYQCNITTAVTVLVTMVVVCFIG